MPLRAPIAKPAGSATSARDRERHRRADGLRRLYDTAQWRKRTQPAVLARDPFCKIGKLCGGDAPSTDADHIIPAAEYVAKHGGDQRYFFDLNNLQGACHADHTAKTARGG
jgi:5-methylcytosine-specific restriction endonuclease McrA